MTTTWTPDEQREHRRLWVAALRSGEYEQAIGALRRADNSMCCLGVACQLSGLGKWDGADYLTATGSSSQILSHEMMGWLGLSTRRGSMTHQACLAEQNDFGASFLEIADVIESEPPGLLAEPIEAAS